LFGSVGRLDEQKGYVHFVEAARIVAEQEPGARFAIAGEDKHFVWGDARIEGDGVVVSSAQVANPVAVRYAWDINPVCNLYNQSGLPAVPFRTDDWAIHTQKR